MSTRTSWDTVFGTDRLRQPAKITAFADQGTGRTTRIEDLQPNPATELGERVFRTLHSRMEFAMRSVVPPGVDSVEWLTEHRCEVIESPFSQEPMVAILYVDGKRLGSWELYFDSGSVRIAFTGILELPPVCPECCHEMVLAGAALPGDVCPGCESVTAVESAAAPAGLPYVPAVRQGWEWC
jgi:hypothetical protein